METEKIPKYLLETDVLIQHLTTEIPIKDHCLIKLMQKGICFTSVLNASELFLIAKTDLEKNKVRDLLNALKVLGLHSRYSLSVSACKDKFNNIRDALFYILAEQNRLVIVSNHSEKYTGLRVKSIHPDTIL